MRRARARFVPAALAPLAAALVLAGCSLAPKYERPQVPLAASFPDAQSVRSAQGRPAAADLAWKDFFGDERLRRLIGIALENNRDLRVAALNVEKAQAQFRVQRAAQFPTVNAALTSQRERPSSSQNYASIGIGITSYEIDFFGRIQSLKDAALAQYLSTEESRRTTQISLVASVVTAYLNLLADDELLRVTQETLKTREESFRLSKLKLDNGVSSELDLRQAEGLVEAARASLAQLQRQRSQDVNTLVLLLGQPALPADLPAGRTLAEQAELLAAVPAGLPSDLLQSRPDVRAAEQSLVAAHANIGAARAAFFPRVGLTASLGRASTSLSNLFDESTRAWTFIPQITLPIFDAGANQANLDVARANQGIAVAQYEKAVQTAFREVADALAGSATLGEQLRATEAQVRAAQASFNLSDLRYRNGVASYLDLLDAQRSLFTAQQSAVQIRLALLTNQITLYKALGGGWTAADDGNGAAAAAAAPAPAGS
nr:efflux transporter outer membrane subunit [Xylophilus sp.]